MTQELFKLPPFISIILKKDNQILLLKRMNTGFADDLYAFPAGKVDGNEPMFQAAVREVKEELGVMLDEQSSKVVHVCHYKGINDFEGLSFYVLAEKWEGEPRNSEPDRHEYIKWFDIDKLPSDLITIHSFCFDKIQENIFYSEFGWDKPVDALKPHSEKQD